MSEVKRAHVRGLLHAFKVPTQSILRTQQQANEQASKYLKISTNMGAYKDIQELYRKKQSDVLRFLFRVC